MGARFFGQFELERGVITAEALVRAVEHQQQQNLKLGELAVREGMLTREDAEILNLEQRRTDAKFGEVALRLCKLNEQQVGLLLQKQKEGHLYIGEALLAVKALDRATLEKELAAYAKEQERDRIDLESSTNAIGWAKGPAYAACVQLTGKLLLRVADVVTKAGPPREVTGTLPGAQVQVDIPFTGGWAGDYILRLPRAVAVKIASRMIGEPHPAPELVLDGAKEFANTLCGQACAALAPMGLNCDLKAPKDLGAGAAVDLRGRKAAVFPLDAAEGTLEVVMAPLG